MSYLHTVLLYCNSTHPRSTKVRATSSQLQRAATVAITDEGARREMIKISTILRANKYPEAVIKTAQ